MLNDILLTGFWTKRVEQSYLTQRPHDISSSFANFFHLRFSQCSCSFNLLYILLLVTVVQGPRTWFLIKSESGLWILNCNYLQFYDTFYFYNVQYVLKTSCNNVGFWVKFNQVILTYFLRSTLKMETSLLFLNFNFIFVQCSAFIIISFQWQISVECALSLNRVLILSSFLTFPTDF